MNKFNSEGDSVKTVTQTEDLRNIKLHIAHAQTQIDVCKRNIDLIGKQQVQYRGHNGLLDSRYQYWIRHHTEKMKRNTVEIANAQTKLNTILRCIKK